MRLIEAERAQIGHEIHDGLLPLIFAASATVSSLLDATDHDAIAGRDLSTSDCPALPAESREKIRQVHGWLADAMQAGRRLLSQAYPPDLIGTLWVNAAKDAIDRIYPDLDVPIQWQVDPEVNETSPPIALAAYRITVEAIRNAIEHGRASEVVIRGEKSLEGFRVRIRDNGAGFDPADVPSDRFGIRSITGRAALVGGSAQVDSQPGGPTTVTFVSHVDGGNSS